MFSPVSLKKTGTYFNNKMKNMWKLKNKLFKWDYIIWTNLQDAGIARVIVLKDGTIGYWRYRSLNLFDEIKDWKEVYWLTCHPSKYF